MKDIDVVQNNLDVPEGLKTTIMMLGVLTSVIGVVVMLGWFLHMPQLIKIFPKFNSMKFNTALGFFLGGIGLATIYYPRTVVTVFVGALLIFLGTAVLLQYITGMNLGIDQLLWHDYLTKPDQFPGRMAPQTAFCFLVFGSCFLIDYLAKDSEVVHFCRCLWGSLLLIIGFTGIFGFIFHIPFAYSWGSYNALAVHTATGFILLGTGMMLTAYRKFYLPLIIISLGGVTLAVQTYYGLSSIESVAFKIVIPWILLGMIILFTVFTVIYIYTQIRRRILIENVVIKRTQEIRYSEERLKLATRGGGIGIWDWDLINNVIMWDDQMYRLYGVTKEEFSVAYDAWQAGLHPEDMKRTHEELQQALRNEKEFDSEFRVVWPDKSIHYIKASGLVTFDEQGKPVRMVGMNLDITEHHEHKEELFRLSTFDELTGLHNRRGFKILVEQQMKEAKRSKRSLILFLIDLNKMKQINDQFGHNAGDLALTDTAGLLKKSFRETDIVCRWGGDEFVVLGVDTAEEYVSLIKQRLQSKLDEHNVQSKRDFKLSMSVGEVITGPDAQLSLEELIVEADKKMYHQKKNS